MSTVDGRPEKVFVDESAHVDRRHKNFPKIPQLKFAFNKYIRKSEKLNYKF